MAKNNMELDMMPMADMGMALESLGVTPAQYAALDGRVQANTDAVGVLDGRVTDTETAVTALTTELTTARNGEASLDERLDGIDLAVGDRYTKDETDGLLAGKANLADSLTLENWIRNGDFSQGTSGWTSHLGRGVLSTSDKILRNTGNGTNVNVISRVDTKIPFVIGRKIYIKAKARVTNGICKELKINTTNVGFSGPIILLTQLLPIENQWYIASNVATISINVDTAYLNFYQIYETASDSNDKVLEIDGNYGVLAVDLTKTFGAGNEPTKLEMDELMKVIPNGWWDGEISLTQKQFITWQLNLIRKNTNAIIALGGTII